MVSERNDFNDDLAALGPHGLAAHIAALTAPAGAASTTKETERVAGGERIFSPS